MIRVTLFAMLILTCWPAVAQQRHAFVVGIDTYLNVPSLQKARNDATSVAIAFEQLGFNVTSAMDLDRRTFNQELAAFVRSIQTGDEVVFFFAGHAIEIRGANYLLPADIPNARPGDEDFVTVESISTERVLNTLRRAGASITIMILDACRDNPFERAGTRSVGSTRGLNIMAAPEGSFVLYSAGAGQTALDRLGDLDTHPNSVFTRALVPSLLTPGLSLTELARRVREEVQDTAQSVGHLQRPAYYDEITSDYFFLGPRVPQLDPQSSDAALVPHMGSNTATVQPIVTPTVDPCETADLLWRTLAIATSPNALRSFIETYRSSCAPLAALANDRLTSLTSVSTAPERPITPPFATTQNEYPRPSWCPNAGTPTERAICNTSTLSALDIEMVQIYDHIMSIANSTSRSWLRSDQSSWLQRRDSCGGNASCIEYEYRTRIQRLQQL